MITNIFLLVSAIGIFLLVILAAVALYLSYRARKESKILNAHLQALNEILSWATEAQQSTFLSASPKEEGIREVRMRLSLLPVRGEAMIRLGSIFGDEIVDRIRAMLQSVAKLEKSLTSKGAPYLKALSGELWNSSVDLLIALHNHRIELLCFTRDYARLLSQTKRLIKRKVPTS